MRQGVLCIKRALLAPTYIRLIIPTGRILAPHGLGPPDRGYGVIRTSSLRSSKKFAKNFEARRYLDFRINQSCKLKIKVIDVRASDDRLAVLRDIARNLVAHNRVGVGMRSSEKRGFLNWG